MASRHSLWRSRARTPTVLQMEATECGAAALGIILGYYGRWTTLEELRIACGVSRDGASAANIVKAARSYGLIARGFNKELHELQQMVFPVVVYWEFRHFVVVEGFARRKVYINDPDTGPRTVSLQEFDKSFTGVVLDLKQGPDFTKGGRRSSVWQAIGSRLPESSSDHVFIFSIALALTLLSLAVPVFSKLFIDSLSSSGPGWLKIVFWGVGLTALGRGALTLWQQSSLLMLQTKLAMQSSAIFFWHLLRLPVDFFTQRMAGEISNRVEINDRIAELLSRDFVTQLINVLLVGLFLSLMAFYDARLALLIAGIAVLDGSVHYRMSRLRLDANRRILQERGKLIGLSINGIQSIESLKANGAEAEFLARWTGQYAQMLNAEQDLSANTAYLPALSLFLTASAAIAVLILGGLNVITGAITIGMLIAFQGLSSNFKEPMNRLIDQGDRLQQVHADLNRVDDVLSHQVDRGMSFEQGGLNANPEGPPAGQLELEHITFGYGRASEPIIRDLSLRVTPGQRIAIVGRSGSGKSTVAKLCCGLYRIWSGRILLDGRELEQYDRNTLNQTIAMVDQDIFLFAGTVGNNLTMWNEAIPIKTIEAAVADACIDFPIGGPEDRYGAHLQENGRNLSGGQRQRLEIARALISNPQVLILDEATSSLDPRMEKSVSDNIRRRGCACIILAHRLSTIRDCDEIIVLEDGNAVQSGTHDQLSQVEGAYLRLLSAT